MKVKPEGHFTYSADVVEEYGRFPQFVAKVEYPVVMARVKTEKLCLDPANQRLSFEELDLKRGGFSKNDQKKLQDALTSDDLAGAKDKLERSLRYHGGQNEAIWVQYRNGHLVVVEGNRRTSLADIVGWDTIIVMIFPDQMPEEHVNDIVNQRHVAGIEQWTAPVRSKVAYEMLANGRDKQEVTDLLQFKNVGEMERFAHSHYWMQVSGLEPRHWSKMNHAYRPVLVKAFGYDKDHVTNGGEAFREDLREVHFQNGKQADLSIADKAVSVAAKKHGMKASGVNFEWLVELIKSGRITDCRQCDGIVSPLVHHADEDYAPKAFDLLHQKPSRTSKVQADNKTLENDGQGSVDPEAPAQQAWNYVRSSRTKNHVPEKVEALRETFRDITKSATKLAKFREPNPDNVLLRSEVRTLIATLQKFLSETAGAEDGPIAA